MTKTKKYLWFIGSLALNALGNSFMITGSFGSAPWASASQNLALLLPLSIGLCNIILQSFALLLNALLGKRLSIKKMVESLVLAVIFGLLIDIFVALHHLIYVPDMLWMRILYFFIGMNTIAAAVSIYFQISTILLPFDYLIKIFAAKTKSYAAGTVIALSIPILCSLLFGALSGGLAGIGIGTLLFMLFNGTFISLYNRVIRFSYQLEKE